MRTLLVRGLTSLPTSFSTATDPTNEACNSVATLPIVKFVKRLYCSASCARAYLHIKKACSRAKLSLGLAARNFLILAVCALGARKILGF
jgi:hypothetical protein